MQIIIAILGTLLGGCVVLAGAFAIHSGLGWMLVGCAIMGFFSMLAD